MKCSKKSCEKDADDEKVLFDEDGKSYATCDSHANEELSGDELKDGAERYCPTCRGEGFVEVDRRHACTVPLEDCCGGCYDSEPCPDCGEEEPEPDWDSIREAREEARIEEANNAEVDWESPY